MLLLPKQVGQIMVKLHLDMLLMKYDSFSRDGVSLLSFVVW